MSEKGKGVLGDPEVTGEQIRQAWEYAALEAMQEHRRTGVPVTTWDWETNRIVMVSADEFPMPDEQTVAGKSALDEKG
jgi:hypothetical protein